ncbi:hypothetical protein NDK50_00060 [Paraburkholderia bryophila]|uniref:hypothetical protein n=1 Tax=Paraburkholderia bryophila TaxID=420952 RepID=UPI00234B5652|nr:hypothetical protein [Paraburkholderia bryophila]WCM19919.1 hypothetical protein NDK50_00060 [Paraburkholderia bryophila]
MQRRFVFPLAATAVVMLVLADLTSTYGVLPVLFWTGVIVSVAVALAASLAGAGKSAKSGKPLWVEKLGIDFDGPLEWVAASILLAYPLFQLCLFAIAWISNGTTWLGMSDVANITSFWAISVAAAATTSASQFSKGSLSKNLAKDDCVELAQRLEKALLKSAAMGRLGMLYLFLGIATQVVYWRHTIHLIGGR